MRRLALAVVVITLAACGRGDGHVLSGSERQRFDLSQVNVVADWATDDFETDYLWFVVPKTMPESEVCDVVLKSMQPKGCEASLSRNRAVEVQRVEIGDLQSGAGTELWFEGFPVKLSTGQQSQLSSDALSLGLITAKSS